jgi:hypothetical protein
MASQQKASRRSSKKIARRGPTTVIVKQPHLGPPQFRIQPVLKRVLQVQIAAANCTNQVVTVLQLGKLLVSFMALTATTSAFIANQFRVRKISLWSPTPAIGSLTMVSLKYSDTNTVTGQTGPNEFFGDSSMEPDRPAYCWITPPKGTPFDFFYTVTGTPNYFVLTAPIGSVLEFIYEQYLDNSGTVTTGPTLIGGTAGVIYNASVTLTGGALLVPHTSVNTISA